MQKAISGGDIYECKEPSESMMMEEEECDE